MYTSCHNYGLNYGDVDKGHRANGFTTDGGFCEYQVNNINTLVALQDEMSDEEGTLVVTEQEGRLDASALGGADRVSIGGHDAYVLSYAPWHVVWQCGSTVVQVVAGDDASTFVEAFPVAAFDDGVPARISRGWSTVAGVLDRP